MPIVWTDVLLRLKPEQELQIARDSRNFSTVARAEAYARYEAKMWYETIVLAPRVILDIPQLSREEADEVLALRAKVGTRPPWKEEYEVHSLVPRIAA